MPNHAKAIEAARNAYSGVAGEQPWDDGLTAAITAFLRTAELTIDTLRAALLNGKSVLETLANEVEQG